MLPVPLRRIACLAYVAFLCMPALAVAAGTASGEPTRREPLNLSIPHDVMLNANPANQNAGQNGGVAQQTEDRTGVDKPVAGAPRREDASDAPYGTGYEARQRRFGGGGGGFGGGSFGGGGFGGGRGGGRGR